jgi:hypothetical protein
MTSHLFKGSNEASHIFKGSNETSHIANGSNEASYAIDGSHRIDGTSYANNGTSTLDILNKYVPLYFRHPIHSEERRIVIRLVTEQLQLLFPTILWNQYQVREFFYHHFITNGSRKASAQFFRDVSIIPLITNMTGVRTLQPDQIQYRSHQPTTIVEHLTQLTL